MISKKDGKCILVNCYVQKTQEKSWRRRMKLKAQKDASGRKE